VKKPQKDYQFHGLMKLKFHFSLVTQIPDSSEGKPWYTYVDETVTLDTLKKLTEEYLQILDRSPSKFKNKMKSITNGQGNVSSPKSFSINSISTQLVECI
jgi:hypothetical protein